MTTETPPPPAGREWPPSEAPTDDVPPTLHSRAEPPAPTPQPAPALGAPVRLYAVAAVLGVAIVAVLAVLLR